MLKRIIIILEILTIIVGMYRVHGKKLKVNIPNSVLAILMLLVLELVNFHQVPEFISNINFVLVYIFCLYEFKDSFSNTIISFGLAISLISINQFIGIVLSEFISTVQPEYKNLIAGIVSLIAAIVVLPLMQIQKLRESILKRHWLKIIIVVFMVSIFLLMLIQGKMLNGISVDSFIFVIPAIIIILLLMLFWDKSLVAEKQLKYEMDTVLAMHENYEGLLEKVQANQHDLKNHLLALVATQYTYKTYDQLIDAQKEYCELIEDDAKYNGLLKISNRTLGGFLYGKMLEIESSGIILQYNIATPVGATNIPYYYLIEILGILIDNAIDATLEYSGEKIIYIGVEPWEHGYKFKIRNTYREVRYEEILSWFTVGKTTKMQGKGIGLSQANKLCKEWECDMIYQSVNIDNHNWILFEVDVKQKEDE